MRFTLPAPAWQRSFFIALWFALLTFPIMVIRVHPLQGDVEWRWYNLLAVAVGAYALSLAAHSWQARKKGPAEPNRLAHAWQSLNHRISALRLPLLLTLAAAILVLPFYFSTYQTTIISTALIYVVLGLGLNIVVGLAGLLDLGYVAFYAVGAYAYALLHLHFGLGFWTVLPIGAGLGALFGILLGFPVLRLRGDYLAIVTLGFGEIVRLILENWNGFSHGPSGIANIPRPALFGLELSVRGATIYLYFLMIGLTVFTVLVVRRLQNSRIGRAWMALREDEIACQAMGIDKTRTKLTAFALGAMWAGMMGVVFAAKTTFVNPASFTFMESAIILAIVVLGGRGSVAGVAAAAGILILLPEYLRAFADYRMLLFGAIMVAMMIFRPQGLAGASRPTYPLPAAANPEREKP